ncbi:MAG: metal-dependent transcriptional regulator [Halobacteriales archaeon SW_9_67_25]|nr:MAG: metal-dependent transcriptional regulator [Halobacteriales archaeon SW_9_67_25]
MNTANQYLKAIYLVQQVEDGPAATGAIADMLDVSPASANEMIGKLEDKDLCSHEKYKGVDLTDDGIQRAREALQNYCIIEREPQCPDCFHPEEDVCALLEVEADPAD